ncbi:MAG: hypothetical protein ACYC4U_02370 [Pirellulaceae bacterium]
MINRTSLTKSRRTRDQIRRLRGDLLEVIKQYHPMTVRQVYYQAVTRGLIDKTEACYKNVICRLLGEMRRDDQLPYNYIADNTRWMRKPDTYSNLADMLTLTQQTYRRAVWSNQDVRVEVWLEKEALAGVLMDVTSKWDVPLMVTRGYPSISYLYSAAATISNADKFTHIYYFGDHDPSGHDISRCVEAGIGEVLVKHNWTPSDCFAFERVAVNLEQIERWSLPTRPTKKTDSRSKNFEGESVEVDAIEPDALRELCREAIEQHIDQDAYDRLMAVESAERGTLQSIVDRYAGGREG